MAIRLVVGVHDQDRPPRAGGDVGGDAVRYPAAELAVAVGADHDQAGLVLVGSVHDRPPGGRSLDRQRRCPEPGRLGQRGAVLGGLLGGLCHVAGAGRVELCAGLGHEPDAEGAPHGEDYRVAPGG
ncbi:MAG TPA: hypothetical protein VEJ42_09415 [Streptosporangiaceae bacterium]|nr:hypothetical protein [Streptosporangiaceae bacterium]